MTLISGSGLFSHLFLHDWRQFENLEIEFDRQLTVLTGANATGKSTVLSLLARHFNWGRIYSTAPDALRSKSESWSSLAQHRARRALERGEQQSQVGTLTYSDGLSTEVFVPIREENIRTNYDILMPAQQPVIGLYMSSHRMVPGNYVHVPTVPTVASVAQLFDNFTQELRSRWSGEWSGRSPQLALKEGLIVAALLGGENRNIRQNYELTELWDTYQSILRSVMPAGIRFRRLSIRMPEVVIETGTGDFILDEASGGLSSIIEMSWQIFLRSWRQPMFVALIDEPENHLHPSLQREILPNMLSAFPNVQFVVATHSPFVVTASPSARVYALDRLAKGGVFARLLDYRNKAASADETLKRVLGLESTAPVWAESRFDEIVARHMRGSMTIAGMEALRLELSEAGIINEFPRAVLEMTADLSDEGSHDKEEM